MIAAAPSCGAFTPASDPPKLPNIHPPRHGVEKRLHTHTQSTFTFAGEFVLLSAGRSRPPYLPMGVRMALTMTGWRAESADRKLMARVAPPRRSNALIFMFSSSPSSSLHPVTGRIRRKCSSRPRKITLQTLRLDRFNDFENLRGV